MAARQKGEITMTPDLERQVQREVTRLKRHHHIDRETHADYVEAVMRLRPHLDVRDVREATLHAIAQPTRPMIHEYIGLIQMARRDRIAQRYSGTAPVREGAYVADRDCHNCGGDLEWREPFLWCPACNAVQQVGRDLVTGQAQYALDQEERRTLRPGPAHEWPETPEEARERLAAKVRDLAAGMDMNSAL